MRLVGISEGVGHYTYKNSKNIDDSPRYDSTYKEERGEKGGKTTVGGIEWSAEIPIGSAVPVGNPDLARRGTYRQQQYHYSNNSTATAPLSL